MMKAIALRLFCWLAKRLMKSDNLVAVRCKECRELTIKCGTLAVSYCTCKE